MSELKRFIFTANIDGCEGYQQFYIDAASQREAKRRAELNETDGMYSSEPDITSLGPLDLCNETTVDDFGDFPPEATQPSPAPIEQPVAGCDLTAELRLEANWRYLHHDGAASHLLHKAADEIDSLYMQLQGLNAPQPVAMVGECERCKDREKINAQYGEMKTLPELYDAVLAERDQLRAQVEQFAAGLQWIASQVPYKSKTEFQAYAKKTLNGYHATVEAQLREHIAQLEAKNAALKTATKQQQAGE